jgi:WD40 repeat protein
LRTFDTGEHSMESVCMSADDLYALSGCSALMLWDIGSRAEISVPLTLSRLPDTDQIILEQSEFQGQLKKASQRGKDGDFSEKYNILRKIMPAGQNVTADFLEEWAGLYTRLPKKRLLGAIVRELPSDQINLLRISTDGKYALTGWAIDCFGHYDLSNLTLWDVPAGRGLHKVERQRDMRSVCVSADGRHALSGGFKTLELWDTSTGKRLRTFDGHAGWVTSVCISSDGRYALSGGEDKTIWLWDVPTGQCLRTFEGHSLPVTAVCMSADGRYVLSGSGGDFRTQTLDMTLKLWDISTGECLRTITGHSDNYQLMSADPICMSADSRYAISGSTCDGEFRLWDISGGECLRTFQGHAGWVHSACMSADGRYALTGSRDKTIKLWDIPAGECLHTYEWHAEELHTVCLSADGRHMLSASRHKLLVWSLYWDLEPKEPADWDEGAQVYLANFLTTHTPYAGEIPAGREPSEDEVYLALTRKGKPVWAEEDFQRLLYDLGCAGYGWLRPEGVRTKLNELAEKMKDGVLRG